jgi:ribonuclease P protein component
VNGPGSVETGRMQSKSQGFPRGDRIRRRAEFEDIYKRGVRLRGRFMTLFALPNGRSVARLGIAATRKLGGAVRRNLAKRLAREWFRHHKPADALDVVIIPRRELFEAPRAALEADYCATLRRFSRARHVR